jgi:hypothetical protein
MSEEVKEVIVKAATIYKGKIYTGWRHDRIGLQMLKDGVLSPPFPGGKAQAFVTNTGRFVSREEALAIAKAAGQYIRKTGNQHHLFSEELWDVNGVPWVPQT